MQRFRALSLVPYNGIDAANDECARADARPPPRPAPVPDDFIRQEAARMMALWRLGPHNPDHRVPLEELFLPVEITTE